MTQLNIEMKFMMYLNSLFFSVFLLFSSELQARKVDFIDCMKNSKLMQESCEEGLCLNYGRLQGSKAVIWLDYEIDFEILDEKSEYSSVFSQAGKDSKTIYQAIDVVSYECKERKEALLFVSFNFSNAQFVTYRDSLNSSDTYLVGSSEIGEERLEIIENILKNN
ncbi:hypothetical protein [Vibrio nigripulchritudo]|nr:hypothetical protein [Vibrio nigripulchritudo]